MTAWVRQHISRRFNYECVESVTEMDKVTTTPAVTRDGLEPDGREDVAKLQLVVDLRYLAVGLDKVRDVGFVKVTLRQQRTGDCG